MWLSAGLCGARCKLETSGKGLPLTGNLTDSLVVTLLHTRTFFHSLLSPLHFLFEGICQAKTGRGKKKDLDLFGWFKQI